MNVSTVNSSPSASGYYWTECDTYNDGAGQLGGPSAGLLILFISTCFEFVVSLPSNLWLICHILSNRSKDGRVLPADFFPLHQALAQLTFNTVTPLLFVNHYVWKTDSVLTVMQFVIAMGLVMKPLLSCLVCVEMYMAVVRPLDYLRFKDHRYRWGCLAVSWCIYIILSSTAVFWATLISYCGLFITVLVIDTYCCLSVLKTLQKPPPGDANIMEKKKKSRENKRKTLKDVSPGGREEEKVKRVERNEPRRRGEMNSMKRKAFHAIVIIQAVLTLNYLPLIITVLIDRLVPTRTLKCQYLAMSLAAAVSCSYLQPLLYMHRLRRLPCMTPRDK